MYLLNFFTGRLVLSRHDHKGFCIIPLSVTSSFPPPPLPPHPTPQPQQGSPHLAYVPVVLKLIENIGVLAPEVHFLRIPRRWQTKAKENGRVSFVPTYQGRLKNNQRKWGLWELQHGTQEQCSLLETVECQRKLFLVTGRVSEAVCRGTAGWALSCRGAATWETRAEFIWQDSGSAWRKTQTPHSELLVFK